MLRFITIATLPTALGLEIWLAFLVGTWHGSGEIPGMGKFTDEITYEWAMDKNFLKASYTAKADGKVVWTDISMMGWDADQKKIACAPTMRMSIAVGFMIRDGHIGV